MIKVGDRVVYVRRSPQHSSPGMDKFIGMEGTVMHVNRRRDPKDDSVFVLFEEHTGQHWSVQVRDVRHAAAMSGIQFEGGTER